MRGTIEVHRYLTERGIPHEFYRLERPLRRIDEAAAILGLDPMIVVRTELYHASGTHVLTLTPASSGSSSSAVARAVSRPRVRPLTRGRIAAHSGFLPDWLPPVGHERTSRALIDETLLDAAVLYAPGGDPGVMLVIPSTGLIRATAATVASLSTATAPETAPSAATRTLS